MDKKALLQAIQNPQADHEFLRELQERLSIEFRKPVEEQDYDLIDDLTDTIALMTGTDQLIARRAEAGIAQLQQRNKQRRSIRLLKRLKICIPCACALIIILSNVWSFSALGMNAFSAVYHILNGGITINMTTNSDASNKNNYDYASEMQSLCEQHGFCPVTPSYLPDGMSPTDIYGTVGEDELCCILFFNFRSRNSTLNFQFTAYNESSEIPPLGIPTDTFHITEEEMNGVTVYIMEEDEQFTAAFLIDRIQYLIAAKDLNYDECQRVLTSMFQ